MGSFSWTRAEITTQRSKSYRGTYENCKGVSYGDPEQGCSAHKWNEQEYRRLYNRVKELNNI